MTKEEYVKNLDILDSDFWFFDMNGKVSRLNELIDGGYISEEKKELSVDIRKWNLRCASLLREYERLTDKEYLESPEKYILPKV